MYQVSITSYQLCIVSKHNTIHRVLNAKQRNRECAPPELHRIIYAHDKDFNSEVNSSLSLQLLPFFILSCNF